MLEQLRKDLDHDIKDEMQNLKDLNGVGQVSAYQNLLVLIGKGLAFYKDGEHPYQHVEDALVKRGYLLEKALSFFENVDNLKGDVLRLEGALQSSDKVSDDWFGALTLLYVNVAEPQFASLAISKLFPEFEVPESFEDLTNLYNIFVEDYTVFIELSEMFCELVRAAEKVGRVRALRFQHEVVKFLMHEGHISVKDRWPTGEEADLAPTGPICPYCGGSVITQLIEDGIDGYDNYIRYQCAADCGWWGTEPM